MNLTLTAAALYSVDFCSKIPMMDMIFWVTNFGLHWEHPEGIVYVMFLGGELQKLIRDRYLEYLMQEIQLILLKYDSGQYHINYSPLSKRQKRTRPFGTTMPWSIWPALVVLWGVCWMFYTPLNSADKQQFELSLSGTNTAWGLFSDSGL